VTPDPSGSWPRRRGPRLLHRTAQLLLRNLYTALAVLGVLTAPPLPVLLVAPLLGLTAVAMHAYTHRSITKQLPPGDRLLLTAAAGTGFLPFTHAMTALQGPGLALGLLVIGLFILLTALGIRCRLTPARSPLDADRAGAAASTPGSVRELLAVLPLDLLCAEWRDLHRHPAEHPAALPYRQLLLDELQLRDPVGFDRWRRCAPDQPPARHLRTDRDVAS
jgi:hypothetical protein